jgi:hypothetical protein
MSLRWLLLDKRALETRALRQVIRRLRQRVSRQINASKGSSRFQYEGDVQAHQVADGSAARLPWEDNRYRTSASAVNPMNSFVAACRCWIFRVGRTDGEACPRLATGARALPSGRHVESVCPCLATRAYDIRCNIVCRNLSR